MLTLRVVRLLWLCIALIGFGLLPQLARAQQPTAGEEDAARAAALKRQGDEKMSELEYAEALELYNQAYELNRNPALYYNRGRAYQALRRFPEALDELELFEREAPAALKARVPELQKLVDSVRTNVATITIDCNVDGARVLVRRLLVGNTPIDEPLRVNAGVADIKVLADGYKEAERKVTLGGGKHHDLRFELQAAGLEGVLVIRSQIAGAEVLIDGERFGTVPAEAKLLAGEHGVKVRHSDYEDYDGTAVVEPGKRKVLNVELELTPSIVERWWFWTGIGAVVTATVVIAIVATTSAPADSGDIPPGQVAAPVIAAGLWTPVISF